MKKFFSGLATINTLAFACAFSLFLGLAQAQNSGQFPSSGGGGGTPGSPSGSMQFNSTGSFAGSNLNVESADVLGLYDSTNQTTFKVYGTRTDASNYKALFLTWPSANSVTIAPDTIVSGSPGGTAPVLYIGMQRQSGSGGFISTDTSNLGIQFGFAGGGVAPTNSLIWFNSADMRVISTGSWCWTGSTTTAVSGCQTWISSPGAAALQLGTTDAASPASQTLEVQSVVAGTTNTAGANWNITGSKSTGTGVGGSIIFNTSLAGTTGTSQNAATQVEIIDGNGHIRVGNQTAPALTSCGTSPAIVGDDTGGTVTMGTGTPTGCVITFHTAYTNTPNCIVSWPAQALASQSYVTSTTAITLTQTATSSNKVVYICRAQNGG